MVEKIFSNSSRRIITAPSAEIISIVRKYVDKVRPADARRMKHNRYEQEASMMRKGGGEGRWEVVSVK